MQALPANRPREREILSLLAQGLDNRAIAGRKQGLLVCQEADRYSAAA